MAHDSHAIVRGLSCLGLSTLAVLAVLSCAGSLPEVSLEDHACAEDNSCLDGYICSNVTQGERCVALGSLERGTTCSVDAACEGQGDILGLCYLTCTTECGTAITSETAYIPGVADENNYGCSSDEVCIPVDRTRDSSVGENAGETVRSVCQPSQTQAELGSDADDCVRHRVGTETRYVCRGACTPNPTDDPCGQGWQCVPVGAFNEYACVPDYSSGTTSGAIDDSCNLVDQVCDEGLTCIVLHQAGQPTSNRRCLELTDSSCTGCSGNCSLQGTVYTCDL